MKLAYPVILTPVNDGSFAVRVPDLEIYTQGDNIAEAMHMARDAIGMWICFEQDEGRPIPEPNQVSHVIVEPGEIKTLVDIDINEYRRAHEQRTIRKNLTLPSWLNDQAEKAGVNFSQILQDALKKYLGIADHPTI